VAEQSSEAEDRTAPATPQRIERARRDGDAALSRDVVQFASLGAGTLGLALLGPAAGRDLADAAILLLSVQNGFDPMAATLTLLRPAALLALGVGVAAGLGALVATLLQTGFLLSKKGLVPDPSRISPIAGVKRLFGPQGLMELLRTLLKLGAVGVALWLAAGDLEALSGTISKGAGDLAGDIAGRLGGLLAATLFALAAIAVLDLAWTRFSHARRLRMSRQDLREESRENEGDPHFKARRQEIMRARGRRRMMAAVPKATVVITNPTHYAVALAYERGKDAAPRIVAKGTDQLAFRIRAAAEKAGVPIVPNPPLARALWRLPDDSEVPEEHFKAVAEVIAFVWKLRKGRAS
jgi:flagellar biosynthetic protein FlhB